MSGEWVSTIPAKTKPKVAPSSEPQKPAPVQKTISSFLLDSYIVGNIKKKERAAATSAKKKIKEQMEDK